jgi:DNA repair photolyase
MGFWSLNPYIGCAFGCTYCYARYAHRYVVERAAAGQQELAVQLVELPPWLAFERRIFVKHNAAHLLRATLERSRCGVARRLRAGEVIAIGTATDPYQPVERRYRVTRAVLEVLAGEAGLAIGITTKSPLVTRDIDLLQHIAARSRLSVNVSLITLNRALARCLEPRAPTPEARLRAVQRLAAAGIDTAVNIMPVLPGITDKPTMLNKLIEAAARAGARRVHACALRLQATARQRYLPFIEEKFPALVARYRSAYAGSPELSERYRASLRRFIAARCEDHGIAFGTRDGASNPPLRRDQDELQLDLF